MIKSYNFTVFLIYVARVTKCLKCKFNNVYLSNIYLFCKSNLTLYQAYFCIFASYKLSVFVRYQYCHYSYFEPIKYSRLRMKMRLSEENVDTTCMPFKKMQLVR